jgi:hypothetical protein
MNKEKEGIGLIGKKIRALPLSQRQRDRKR